MDQPVHIMLVEDDEIEAEEFLRALRAQPLPLLVTVASDGVEALKTLRSETDHQAMPHIIFLDLNLPRMSGLEFLQILRQDPELRSRVVFVLTTSGRIEDRHAAYQAQVAGYILKSRVGLHYAHLFAMLERYCSINEPPPA
jgi:CheY-like chemotaxis protein